MFNALNREAITLATNGVATLEDIDLAWTTGTKIPAATAGRFGGRGATTQRRADRRTPKPSAGVECLCSLAHAQGWERDRGDG